MRLLLLIFGFALGVASTLVYATFFANPSQAPASTPLEAEPQLSVTLGESLIAEIVKRSMAEAPGTATRPDVKVSLRDDVIAVDASMDVLGQRASGSATLLPVIEGGKLRMKIGNTSLGNLNLPPLEALLEKQINSRIGAITPQIAGMPVTLTGARIDRGRGLTVTGRVDLAPVAVGTTP